MSVAEIILKAKDATGGVFKNVGGQVKDLNRTLTMIKRVVATGFTAKVVWDFTQELIKSSRYADELGRKAQWVKAQWASASAVIGDALGRAFNTGFPGAGAAGGLLAVGARKVRSAGAWWGGATSNMKGGIAPWIASTYGSQGLDVSAGNAAQDQAEAEAYKSQADSRKRFIHERGKAIVAEKEKEAMDKQLEHQEAYQKRSERRQKEILDDLNDGLDQAAKKAKNYREERDKAADAAREDLAATTAAAQAFIMRGYSNRMGSANRNIGAAVAAATEAARRSLDPTYRHEQERDTRQGIKDTAKLNKLAKTAADKMAQGKHLTAAQQYAMQWKSAQAFGRNEQKTLGDVCTKLDQIKDRLAIP